MFSRVGDLAHEEDALSVVFHKEDQEGSVDVQGVWLRRRKNFYCGDSSCVHSFLIDLEDPLVENLAVEHECFS